MRLHIPRQSLLAAMQLCAQAIPAKDVNPTLKNIKAIANAGGAGGEAGGPPASMPRCTLIATDLEVGIRLDVQGLTIEEPGEAILPAAKLIDILREARDTQLVIEADASACVVRGTTSPLEFEMPSEDAGQFPDFPAFNEEKYHEITAGALREMIRRTVFSTADETARYTMTGVCWELEGDQLRLIATDGRRLALAEGIATSVGGHTTTGMSPVVSKKAMSLLERNLQDDPEETVKVCIRRDDAFFRTGRAVIYCRLLEGRFPDWRGVIPKKHTVQMTLNIASFQAAVRQAAIMTDKDGKRVTFRFTQDRLTLLAQGSTSGRSKIEMPLEDYSGAPVDINFNPDYLIEFLKVLPAGADGRVGLVMLDGAKPATFRAGEQYQYLVMPLT